MIDEHGGKEKYFFSFFWILMFLVVIADKNADYDVKVHGVDISPYPVARGREATFSISATTGVVKFSCCLFDWLLNYNNVGTVYCCLSCSF